MCISRWPKMRSIVTHLFFRILANICGVRRMLSLSSVGASFTRSLFDFIVTFCISLFVPTTSIWNLWFYNMKINIQPKFMYNVFISIHWIKTIYSHTHSVPASFQSLLLYASSFAWPSLSRSLVLFLPLKVNNLFERFCSSGLGCVLDEKL